MQALFDSAVMGLSIVGSIGVAVVVQRTALVFLLSCMGCNGTERPKIAPNSAPVSSSS